MNLSGMRSGIQRPRISVSSAILESHPSLALDMTDQQEQSAPVCSQEPDWITSLF
jgi:hypothetical protein